MSTTSEVSTRLTADNSNYRSVMGSSEEVARSAGRNIFKHLDLKDAMRSVATAIGLNFEQIAESTARFILGLSKEEEESLKNVADLSEKTADIYKRIFEARNTDEQNLAAHQAENNRLLKEQASILAGVASRQKEIDQINEGIARRNAESAKDKAMGLGLGRQADLLPAAVQTQKEINDLKVIENQLANNTLTTEELARKGKEADAKRIREDEEDIVAGIEMERQKRKTMSDEDLAWYKQRVGLEKTLREQKIQTLAPEERITFLTQEVAKWKKEQGKYTKEDNEYLALQVKINEDNHDIEQLRLKTAKQITAEMRAQQDAIEAQNVAQAKSNLLLEDTLIINGKAYGSSRDPNKIADASSEELKELIKRAREEIASIEATKGRGDSALAEAATGFLVRGSAEDRLQTDINRAQFQLDLRNRTQRDIAQRGIDAARARFSGDALQFDDFVSRFITGQAPLVTELQKLNSQLNRGVPTVLFGTGG